MLVNRPLDDVALGECQHDARPTHQPSGNASEPRVGVTNHSAIVCPTAGVARHPRAVGCPREKKSQRVGAVDRAGDMRHSQKCTCVQCLWQEAPGRKPGDTGYECQPARHADAVRCVEIVRRGNRDPLPRGVPRLPPGAFCQTCHHPWQEAPGRKPGDTVSMPRARQPSRKSRTTDRRPWPRNLGGSPGTPGVNAIPVAMPMRSDASRSFGVATAIRCHAVSPGFRRGLFVRRATTRGKKPLGGSPGTP